MSTFNLPRLSQSDEAAMRKLHKTIRATRYEDPLDQDAFLVASATSVVRFIYLLGMAESFIHPVS
jgi:hypothetical protein